MLTVNSYHFILGQLATEAYYPWDICRWRACHHGWSFDQDHFLNQAPNAYIWYVTTGQPLPWQNQCVAGPGTFGLDASIFKTIPIKEHVMLRFNADFFSVLNNPGLSQPGSTGILSLQNSANSARTMQLNLRLTW